jgi:hypothetical protein
VRSPFCAPEWSLTLPVSEYFTCSRPPIWQRTTFCSPLSPWSLVQCLVLSKRSGGIALESSQRWCPQRPMLTLHSLENESIGGTSEKVSEWKR